MYDFIREYKTYLESNCRYAEDAVISYLGNLPIIFDNLKIESLRDIDSHKVSTAWKNSRWETIDQGIQVSETAASGYLKAFKEFLRYLEDHGYLGEEVISEIIRIPDRAPEKLRGIRRDEQVRLKQFLLYHVANDTQRKETALTALILSTGCTLMEALNLSVHATGMIDLENDGVISGDFQLIGNDLYVHFTGFDEIGWKAKLPREVAILLNFYLENRIHRTSLMFVNSARKYRPMRLSEAAAAKMVEKALKKAGIETRKGLGVAVLRQTAQENGFGNRDATQPRRIISLRSDNEIQTDEDRRKDLIRKFSKN